MRLRWTPDAADDLERVFLYLNENHPGYAVSTIHTLYDAVRSLRTLPERGKPGRIAGTREFVLPHLPYIITYRLYGQAIEVLRIHHGAQDQQSSSGT